MIFITLGSQKFQFNRLLEEIDLLIEKGKITDRVFAQVGYSDYTPQYYDFKKFLDREEYSKTVESCEIIITHGGTGAIVSSLKKNKKVIAVPRLKEYNEHVDNHQLEIVQLFSKKKFIEFVVEVKDIEKALKIVRTREFNNYTSNTLEFISAIEEVL